MFGESGPRNPVVYTASERQFGWVMAGFFALVGGVVPLLKQGEVRPVLLIVAGTFLALTLFTPTLLKIPNQLWGRLGHLLGSIVSPVVLGVMYFGVFTPLGWIVRTTTVDFFDRRIDRNAKSYWHLRAKEPSSSMKNQF